MRHQVLNIAIVLVVLCLSGCKDAGGTGPGAAPTPRELTQVEKSVVGAGNTFSFDLLRAVNGTDQGRNLFISPFSVSMALGMTLNGAHGTTKSAMQQTLGFAMLSDQEINQSYRDITSYLTCLDPMVKFKVANSIWYRPTVNVEPDFVNANQQYFSATVRSMDFASLSAAGIINDWVKTSTEQKITSIVPDPIPTDIIMYLINAIYFKGTWKYQFDKSITAVDSFTVPNGSTVPCMMMSRRGEFPYFKNEKASGIDLPYGNSGFSMTILLPDASSTVEDLISTITQEQWTAWIASFAPQDGTIFLPRFKIEYAKTLNNELSSLGMGVAFTGQADFTRIDKRGYIAISEVKHKTYVEVNEEGTEAAAVTSVAMVRSRPWLFKINRPFLFVIREVNSETILFMGKVVVPAE